MGSLRIASCAAVKDRSRLTKMSRVVAPATCDPATWDKVHSEWYRWLMEAATADRDAAAAPSPQLTPSAMDMRTKDSVRRMQKVSATGSPAREPESALGDRNSYRDSLRAKQQQSLQLHPEAT